MIKKITYIFIVFTGLLLQAENGKTVTVDNIPLRGFGTVSLQGKSDGKTALAVFECESSRKAEITGAKYYADMQNFGAVVKNGDGTLSVRHGGIWKLGLDGNRVMILSSPDKASLDIAIRKYGADKWKPIPENSYPRYLDNFDNASLAFWWTGDTKSTDEMKCFKSLPAAAALHGNTLESEYAPGVWDNSSVRNGASQLTKAGKPYRTCIWTGQGSRWADYLVNNWNDYDRFVPGYCGRSFHEAGGYYSAQAAGKLVEDGFLTTLNKLMKAWRNDDNLLGWMEPHGEFQLFEFKIPAHSDTRFPEYLRNVKKYSISGLSSAWGDSFKSFADVKLPDPSYFAGRRGDYVDLDDIDWKWTSGTLAEGEKAGYQQQNFDDGKWYNGKRSDKRLLGYREAYSHHPGTMGAKSTSLWMRFNHDITADLLAKHDKVYMHIMPRTERQSKNIALWINGKNVSRKLTDPDCWYSNRHSCIEVAKFLKPGINSFVIFNEGGRIAYRVFLSQHHKERMPFADKALNQRYYDWLGYLRYGKFKKLEKFLTAMRSLDPDRPIKVMTPGNLGLSETMELFKKTGAYAQNTGEANWYQPMRYKGYSFSHNMSSSSEPGGPAFDAYNAQRMFANVFWEAQDCHDYGFDFHKDFFRHKSVVKWWQDNIYLLNNLGKTDLVRKDLGLLRDMDNALLYDNSLIWNYDLSRGTLPGLGLSPVLLNGDDLKKRIADNEVKVILDCATVVMDNELVEAIRNYVTQGGIFITQPITGRDTPYAKKQWPLPEAFGLKVISDRMNGKVKFANEIGFIPSLKGKSIQAKGIALKASGKVEKLASWGDGNGAIVKVKYGKGSFIMLGIPLFTGNMQDNSAIYAGSAASRSYLRKMLAEMGIKSSTSSSNGQVWFEKRQSKNGLYDVYMAGALGSQEKSLKKIISSDLVIDGINSGIIETGVKGNPDVKTKVTSGNSLCIEKVGFSPFKIRIFASVRDDAGLTGPATWLEAQKRSWFAIPKQTFDFSQPEKTTRMLAESLNEDGLDISQNWSVSINNMMPGWLKGPVTGWKVANFGCWLAQGFPENTNRVRYRKTVVPPKEWNMDNSRIFLRFKGMSRYFGGGLYGQCRLFINGRLAVFMPNDSFSVELKPEQCKSGKLELAFDMTAPAGQTFKGPVGAIFLHKFPKPTKVLSLNGSWTAINNLLENGKSINVPFSGNIFGLAKSIDIPAGWKGKIIRLVVEQPEKLNAGNRISNVIINHEGFLRHYDFALPGVRIDRFLEPGRSNLIELFGNSLESKKQNKFQTEIFNIRLEVY